MTFFLFFIHDFWLQKIMIHSVNLAWKLIRHFEIKSCQMQRIKCMIHKKQTYFSNYLTFNHANIWLGPTRKVVPMILLMNSAWIASKSLLSVSWKFKQLLYTHVIKNQISRCRFSPKKMIFFLLECH